jgi:hypothetical protein
MAMNRPCEDCNKMIKNRGRQQHYCYDCSRKRVKEAQKKQWDKYYKTHGKPIKKEKKVKPITNIQKMYQLVSVASSKELLEMRKIVDREIDLDEKSRGLYG